MQPTEPKERSTRGKLSDVRPKPTGKGRIVRRIIVGCAGGGDESLWRGDNGRHEWADGGADDAESKEPTGRRATGSRNSSEVPDRDLSTETRDLRVKDVPT